MSFKINISVASFAESIGCTSHHVRSLIHSGVLNAIKIGKNYKFSSGEAENYIYSKENSDSVTFMPTIFTKEILEDLLNDYPSLITTQEFGDFFDITNVTTLAIVKDLPHIFYGNRGGYKIRKEIFIDYILENQTLNLSNSKANRSEETEES